MILSLSSRGSCLLGTVAGFIVAALLSSVTNYAVFGGRSPLRSNSRERHRPAANHAVGLQEPHERRPTKPPKVDDVPNDDVVDGVPSGVGPGMGDLVWYSSATSGAPKAHVEDAKERLAYMWDCMDSAIVPECRPDPAARANVLPFEEWMRHTKELIALLKPFRKLPPEVFAPLEYNYSHYSGPWIEADFVEYFLDGGRYELFYPLVPLFAQWTDSLHGPAGSHDALMTTLFGAGSAAGGGALRSDVAYITLMQYDRVREGQRRGCAAWRNVFLFSSAGWGNVPIPHTKGLISVNFDTMWPPELDPVHYYKRKFVSTYVGANTFGRSRLWGLVADKPSTVPGNMVIHMASQMWRWMENGVLWSLAPRGLDRATWRTAETLQYGRVPVVLHTDEPWVPYQHTFDFLEPGKLPAARLGPGGERDVAAQQGAVLRGEGDAVALPAAFDPEDAGPQYWGGLVTPGAMWGPGGVGFAMHFDELPSFWCLACEFLKPGSAAQWRHVRTLPLHRYGKKPGQECPCSSPDVWVSITNGLGKRDAGWNVSTTSLLYEMERRVHALIPQYFSPAAVIRHVLEYVQAPAQSALKCVPRPATFQPPK